MSENKQLLIVYHSQSGSTTRMAEAVETGARHPDIDNVEVRRLDALAAGVEDLLWADGLILGTPENFGYMSGALKHFLDQVYYPCQDKVSGMPYALFVRAGNDGSGAIKSIQRIVSGLNLKQVHEPILMCGDFDEQQLQDCEELGMLLAAGLEAGVF
ncbi:flavodoxin family protein [Woeseia oceani]|uniref:Flavodoxin n=1 Tax=Woeseia oceani TaxID=1548547 RepID=A0A193LKM5_9GAMM|nr:NAD(P)H-dependent oxidoreductase [Woeseia oceani]ANO52954.1 flavodoxin [Woeseia oceani]